MNMMHSSLSSKRCRRSFSGVPMSPLNKRRNRGFTIVELLIVIVVIAILAAITIVAYNGVQTKAKASSVQATIAILSKKIFAYQAVTGRLPNANELKYSYAPGTTVVNSGPAEANLGSITLGTILGPSIDSSNGANIVRYVVNNDATPTCGWFDWWDFTNNRITTLSTTPQSIYIGC
jgi:prepilin-type N-terminal cleavage/methylation domain-containing protein